MVWYGMVWYGTVEVCEGVPVAVGGWVLTDRHDLAPCAANSLHRVTISYTDLRQAWHGIFIRTYNEVFINVLSKWDIH